MVRRSSATSRGTTYWFLFLLLLLLFCIPGISLAHTQVFRTEILTKITETKCDKGGEKLDPGPLRGYEYGGEFKAENYLTERLSNLFQTGRRNTRG